MKVPVAMSSERFSAMLAEIEANREPLQEVPGHPGLLGRRLPGYAHVWLVDDPEWAERCNPEDSQREVALEPK